MTTERGSWKAGTTPWVRQQAAGVGFLCYFCGTSSAIRSYGDHPDPGRIEVYCDNTDCDARTIAVLVLQDGTPHTPGRADVQALEAIDRGPAPRADTIGELLDSRPSSATVINRRRHRA